MGAIDVAEGAAADAFMDGQRSPGGRRRVFGRAHVRGLSRRDNHCAGAHDPVEEAQPLQRGAADGVDSLGLERRPIDRRQVGHGAGDVKQ